MLAESIYQRQNRETNKSGNRANIKFIVYGLLIKLIETNKFDEQGIKSYKK